MTLKVTLFYNQVNRGWTETWYKTGDAPPTEISVLDNAVFRRAIAFRAALTTIEWVRFSVVGKPQLVNSFRLSTQMAPPPSTVDAPDVVSTDAIWRLSTASFARRLISLRGLYDDSVKRNPVTGAFEPSAFLFGGANDYFKAATKALYQIRQTQTVVNTPGLFKTQVIQVSPNVLNGNYSDVLVTNPIPGLTEGQKIRITGSIDPRTLPIFPRTPTVKGLLAAGSRIVIDYKLPSVVAVDVQDAFATPLIYNYPVISDWGFQSLSKRDTGRPFGSSRGRQTSLGSRR